MSAMVASTMAFGRELSIYLNGRGPPSLGISENHSLCLSANKMRALISFILLISVAVCGAAYVEGERESVIAAYWREKLPTTPIPQSVQELISGNDGVPLIHLVEESDNSLPKLRTLVCQLNCIPMREHTLLKEAYVKLFLLEKNFLCGNKVSLNFSNARQRRHFLPCTVVDRIPFSSDELSVSLKELNIAPESVAAMYMNKTLQACERPAVKGETKFCATSLESMIDFIMSKLGSNRLTTLMTNVPKTWKSGKQKYSIVGMKYEGKAEKAVYVCYNAKYAYAVYYCHALEGKKVVRVWLKGEDRSTVEAAAICHMDTSAWDPKHPALQRLNVKPGGASVYHFAPQNHLVWVGTT